MRRFMLTVALAALIGMELILAFRFWDGYLEVTREIVMSDLQDNGSIQLQVIEHPFTAWDWLLFTAFIAVVIAANVALVYVFWRDWHSSRTRA